jgi:maltooligosyltrehalose trehalohydrolase
MAENVNSASGRRAGAFVEDNGTVRWRVWAPTSNRASLVLWDGDDRHELAMEREDRGFHAVSVAGTHVGQLYAYCLDGGPDRPDPCSLWQPRGAFGPSAVVDPRRFAWSDRDWRGVPQQDLVFYEIHVGTFTTEGTFDAIIPRLCDLCELGVTALEIMPIGQFPGPRNWGYDGVLPYAAQDSYGGPHAFQSLVDACHQNGLAIYLDVVYNHFGPEANYLAEFGPYFTDRYKTPWGPALNFDRGGCDAVRDYVLDNVRMWLEDFHVDGLRLDAIDAIFDMGARHILRAIREVAEESSRRRGWPAILAAESDLNDPRVLYTPQHGGHGLDIQWMDDYHHAAHAFFTGERQSYYSDFGEASQLARVLEHPFLYHWEYSAFRDRKHGARPEGLSGDRFVIFLQNHDQVGNRASGDRLTTLVRSPARRRQSASYLLLSPYLPLLFMGEEYGEEAPFPFFCSFHDPELVRAVREGRRKEYSAHDSQSAVPDPDALETFTSARLSWSWPDGSERAGLRRLYRDLLTARREWPALRDYHHRTARLISGQSPSVVLQLVRGDSTNGAIVAYFNLGETIHALDAHAHPEQTVLFSSEQEAYSGCRDVARQIYEVLPSECVVFGPPSWRPFP